MKGTTALAVLTILMLAGNALAQIDANNGGQAQMVKERAKRIRDANNASQGATPGAPATAPAAPAPAAPTGPRSMDPAQQQLVDKVQGDLTGIRPDAPVAPDQKQNLENDLMTLSKGATKPSKESVSKLATDLSAALSGKNVNVKDQNQLARAMNVVMNNGNVTAAQAQAFVNATQKILQTAGVGEPEVTAVVTDLKGIVTDLQKNKPHQY
jgi:hypothetical protein